MRSNFFLVFAVCFIGIATASAADKPVIGLEVYSLRGEVAKSIPDAFALMRRMGFTEVETGLYNQPAAEMRKLLDAAGLKCPSVGFDYDEYVNHMDRVIRDTKTLGADYVVIGWFPHQGDFTPDAARAAAKTLNAMGKTLADAGIHLCLHLHGYEFLPVGDGTVFDVLAAATDPKFVNFEIDVYWVFHAGQDPAKLMHKYPDRFHMIHLKDLRKGTQTGPHAPGIPLEASVVIGTGMLDFPAIMREAQACGVKHYFIEDEALTAAKQVPGSLKYLQRVLAAE